MNTKAIALVVVFAALALALSPIRIPVFFWPGQYFRVWEIAIVVAFFMFGLKIGTSAMVLYALGFVTIIPDSSGILGFPWVIVVMLSVFLGLVLARRLVDCEAWGRDVGWKTHAFLFTLLATLSRGIIMPFVDFGVYKFLLPLVIGRPIPDWYILGLAPAIVAFNIIVPLYSVPIAYFVAKVAGKSLRL